MTALKSTNYYKRKLIEAFAESTRFLQFNICRLILTVRHKSCHTVVLLSHSLNILSLQFLSLF